MSASAWARSQEPTRGSIQNQNALLAVFISEIRATREIQQQLVTAIQ